MTWEILSIISQVTIILAQCQYRACITTLHKPSAVVAHHHLPALAVHGSLCRVAAWLGPLPPPLGTAPKVISKSTIFFFFVME